MHTPQIPLEPISLGSSGYNGSIFSPSRLSETIERVAVRLGELRGEGLQFDAIACRGSSGLSVAVPVSYLMDDGTGVILVRKPGESSHGRAVEGPEQYTRFLIVDDLIASGNTIRQILCALPSERCAGILLYADVAGRNSFTPDTDGERIALPVFNSPE